MKIAHITKFFVKMPGSATPIFLRLDVAFMCSKSSLKISS